MDEGPIDGTLRQYYDARAPYYDAGYAGPTAQWVSDMIAGLQAALRGQHVLELACGTGHWTQFAAEVAAHVTATDLSPAMLTIARQKLAPYANVAVRPCDAYRLDALPGAFTAGLAMQWWSHLSRSEYTSFVQHWHRRLGSGAMVFLADNQLTPPWDECLIRKPGDPNTYEPRELPDGSSYVILKNYFTPAELRELFAPHVRDLEITMGARWWWLRYRVP